MLNRSAVQSTLIRTIGVVGSLLTPSRYSNERFEPKCRQTHYQADFQTRQKERTEGWVEFADDLKTLADKGFPKISKEAKEQLIDPEH